MLTAITRGVSPSLNRCELTHLQRQPIDVALAEAQHRLYEDALRELGASVVSLPAEEHLPDCMFVEDPAVVVNEAGVMTRMGAASRRGESESLARVLAHYRPLHWMREPGTLEGGDVLRVGATLFVGLSARTNRAGIEQLADVLRPFRYEVKAVALHGCLHLKSACCALGDSVLLANRQWFDTSAFEDFRMVDVAPEEPRAANVLAIGDTVLIPDAYARTAEIVERLGWKVRALEMSELLKAESGVTCSSILLET